MSARIEKHPVIKGVVVFAIATAFVAMAVASIHSADARRAERLLQVNNAIISESDAAFMKLDVAGRAYITNLMVECASFPARTAFRKSQDAGDLTVIVNRAMQACAPTIVNDAPTIEEARHRSKIIEGTKFAYQAKEE